MNQVARSSGPVLVPIKVKLTRRPYAPPGGVRCRWSCLVTGSRGFAGDSLVIAQGRCGGTWRFDSSGGHRGLGERQL